MSTRTLPYVAAIAIAVGAGCGTSTFRSQVVSCVDKRPIPDAKLTYAEPDGTPMPTNLLSEMPSVTSQDGTVTSEMLEKKGTTYEMTIAKDGYASKTVPLTSGRDQNICLEPATQK